MSIYTLSEAFDLAKSHGCESRVCPLPGQSDPGACLAASVQVDQVEGTK